MWRFAGRGHKSEPCAGSQFDVSPDGQGFLVNARLQGPEPPTLNVMVNWAAEHNAERSAKRFSRPALPSDVV
jgi:hypothetical protein